MDLLVLIAFTVCNPVTTICEDMQKVFPAYNISIETVDDHWCANSTKFYVTQWAKNSGLKVELKPDSWTCFAEDQELIASLH